MFRESRPRNHPIKLRLLIRDFVMQRGVLEAPEEPPDVSTALNMTEKKRVTASEEGDKEEKDEEGKRG
jgi:hypothetical protein